MPEKSTNVFDLLLSLLASEKFIAAFLGLVAGTIATFAAPWTKWKFEKEKIQLENRKEKVRKWRDDINFYDDFVSFAKSQTFHDLKDRFTKEEISSFYQMWLDLNHGIDTEKTKLGRFHEEVSKIEKEWGLI